MTTSPTNSPGNNLNSSQLRGHLAKLAAIGIALSSEQHLPVLLEKIVDEARNFAGADAGTLYLVDPEQLHLQFAIVQNESMQTRMGGSADPISWPPVPLYLAGGEPNQANVSTYVALQGKIVNIPDVYAAEGFDFSGTKKFDQGTGYRSCSMLVIPMQNKEREIIGVLQLINARDAAGQAGPFSAQDVDLIASLASQAAVAITNVRLYQDLENLFDAFIQAIATAIDEKSPYTGGHIRRVQALTMIIAQAMNSEQEGVFKDFSLSREQLRELSLAAWLHDIGKIVTPEHVVDKATKLETIFDRIHLVKARYEIRKRDLKIRALEQALAEKGAADPAVAFQVRWQEALAEKGAADLANSGGSGSGGPSANDHPGGPARGGEEQELSAALARLEEELQFLVQSNTPGEFMGDDKIARLREIAASSSPDDPDQPWLSADELANLSIRKGTLTPAEREIIENHASVTFKMLKKLPFPKKMGKVPEYAAAHHEKLDGSGYPFGLKGEEIALPARIIAIADIFEALTASDRPYKKPMQLSQAFKILGFMAKDGHIDRDILQLFCDRQIYKPYAEQEMKPAQIDC